MRKETFEKSNLKQIICRGCHRILDVNHFAYNSIKNDNSGLCRTCEWFKRHKDIEIRNITKEQLFFIIDKIISQKTTIINEMASYLEIDIENMIDIINQLRIGNKHYVVEVECESCHKQLYEHPSVYLKNKNFYCSKECYWKDKTNKMEKGKDNPCYNRIETECTNCGKLISVIPFDYNKKNSFGDNHNFCSQKCYWEYRSKYYVGDKHTQVEFTEEMRERLRYARIKSLQSQDRLDTKIQLKVNKLLEDNCIEYVREYNVEYYSIDNYLTKYNLMIEVMGDYWHSNPTKYNDKRYQINQKQYDGIHRDKIKHSYVKNHYNIDILYLWEYDINNNEKLCEKLILEYIKKNGILENYNSFNYSILNDQLHINNHIIKSYQEMPCSEYKYLLKKAC